MSESNDLEVTTQTPPALTQEEIASGVNLLCENLKQREQAMYLTAEIPDDLQIGLAAYTALAAERAAMLVEEGKELHVASRLAQMVLAQYAFFIDAKYQEQSDAALERGGN
jgi:hypothetical protein